jgi:hypothetical protein
MECTNKILKNNTEDKKKQKAILQNTKKELLKLIAFINVTAPVNYQ